MIGMILPAIKDKGQLSQDVYKRQIPDAICVKQHLLDIGAANTHTRFVLNHFSHNGGLLYAELSLLAAREGMEVSWDGLEVTV